MNLEIKIEELRKNKIFVGMPCYGGAMNGMCAKSCLDLQGMCQQMGIEMRFSFLFNESLITRARNYLTDEFMRSEFTHLLFIDSDIHFDPRDVLTLAALDKDVVGGPYPKKSIRWGTVAEVARKHADLPPGELEKVIGDFVFNPVAGTSQFNVSEPIEVMEIGTGYMMIKREVFTQMAEKFPETSYKPDHVGQQFFDGSRYINAFFDCYIDRKRPHKLTPEQEVGGSDRYLSEDYAFCQRAREIGFKIWLCPWMKTHHIGTYAFTGDLPTIANLSGKL